jgi:DNA-binding transcriptional LysR family regulator
MIENLRSLAVFAKTAELGSFRAAARALSLSPSVVSHHIGELERRLGLPLLYRSTRRLALTPDGDRLFESAREMCAAAERGLDAVTGRSDNPTGLLRITSPAFLAQTSFSRSLAAFSVAYPNVQLNVSFGDAPQDLLRDGLDLAIRAGSLQDSTHKTRKLGEIRRVLVASPRYLAERKTPKGFRDLATWDFVRLSSRPAQVSATPPGKKTQSVLSFVAKISVDSVAAMREMVLAGVGLATLPEVIVREDLHRQRLLEVLPGFRVASVGVFAVWPSNAQRAGLTARFIDHIATPLGSLFLGAGSARSL